MSVLMTTRKLYYFYCPLNRRSGLQGTGKLAPQYET